MVAAAGAARCTHTRRDQLSGSSGSQRASTKAAPISRVSGRITASESHVLTSPGGATPGRITAET